MVYSYAGHISIQGLPHHGGVQRANPLILLCNLLITITTTPVHTNI